MLKGPCYKKGWARAFSPAILKACIALFFFALQLVPASAQTPLPKGAKQDGIGLVKRLFGIYGDRETLTDLEIRIMEKKRGLANRDFGLGISGFYTNNIQNGVFDDVRASYDSNAYVGLEWDMLKDGLYESFKEGGVFEREIEAKRSLALLSRNREALSGRYYGVIYAFNLKKIEMLKERMPFLDEYISDMERLYFGRFVPWEEVLRLKQERAEASLMLENYVEFNRAFVGAAVPDVVDADSLPVLQVDLAGLVDAEKKGDPYENAALMEEEKALLERTVLDDITLRTFVRYYTDDPFSGTGRDNVAAGLYLKVPLPLNRSDMFEEAELRARLNSLGLRRKGAARLDEIKDAYYEYQYKLKDFYAFLYKKALIEERLRKEYAKKAFNDPDFSMLQLMRLRNELSSVSIESIDIKQQMYLELLQLYTASSAEGFFASIKEADTTPAKRYPGERSVYIWSDAFKRLDNEFLVLYLKNQEFKEAVLSFGMDADRAKLKGFMQMARAGGIMVSAMTGDNALVFEKNRGRIDDLAKEAKAYGGDSIHLDVEPHTLPDWKENMERLSLQYIEMLKYARESATREGLGLSVSIPANLRPEVLREIYGLADKVYVMAYGARDPLVFAERVSEEISEGKGKVTLAIRPMDFEDRSGLEAFLKTIIRDIGVPHIAIHDIKGLLDLEAKEARLN